MIAVVGSGVCVVDVGLDVSVDDPKILIVRLSI